MSRVATIEHVGWTTRPAAVPPDALAGDLEAGDVLFFPHLAFTVVPSELQLFAPRLAAAKNISFDPSADRLGGTAVGGDDAEQLHGLVARFSRAADIFVREMLPAYRDRIEIGRASFRPVEIAGRTTSWRKDDTRLHIDSFPATPVAGRRILRVFTNVNPDGRARSWRIGEDFGEVARRFVGHLKMPLPGLSSALRLVRITKSRRSAYDSLMLQLHDRMKADAEYQRSAPQTAVDFPPGSTWMAFTDQVSHAAMAGQYQLEQTFLVPVDAMLDEKRSPLRVLEGLFKRSLA